MSQEILDKLRRLSANAAAKQKPSPCKSATESEWVDEQDEDVDEADSANSVDDIPLPDCADDHGYTFDPDDSEDVDSDLPDHTHRIVSDDEDDDTDGEGDIPALVCESDPQDTFAERVANLVIAKLRDALNSIGS